MLNSVLRTRTSLPFSVIVLACICSVLSDNLTEPPVWCRNRGGIRLEFEAYKLHTCAACYIYLPTSAFVSKEKVLRYHLITGLLVDLSTNTSFPADPDNISQPVYDTFESDLFVHNWLGCCLAARRCCHKMLTDPPTPLGQVICPRTWDGWQCWPDTPAGETAERPCEEHVYFGSKPPVCPRYAEKKCWDNGTWYINYWNLEWSNYGGCSPRKGLMRWQKFHIATYAVSILFLVPALFIFSTYKHLQVQRITMHKNLFASLIVNAALEITFKTVVVLDELDTSGNRRRIMEENWPGCRLLYTLTKYTGMCTSMWMFCEAFYIHKLIAASFAEQKSLFMFYFIGWIFPIFPVITLAILRWIFADERCWAGPEKPFDWVVGSLFLLSLLLNLVFLINIIRILWTKLRATHASKPSQFRKVVRATLMLIPLFGLHFCLVMYRPKSGNCFLLEGYSFFRYALDGLQGFLVSVIFCYLNGEVNDLIRRSIQRFRLRYSLGIQPTSYTTSAELSLGQSGQSNDCPDSPKEENCQIPHQGSVGGDGVQLPGLPQQAPQLNQIHGNDAYHSLQTSLSSSSSIMVLRQSTTAKKGLWLI